MAFPSIQRAIGLIKTPIVSAGAHRRLLKEFMYRDVRGRFAGSMAGALWALITPLATIMVYLFVFSLVLRIQVTIEETGTTEFAIFFLTGLMPWILFSEGLLRSSGCLIENANLITKVVFPVELLPAGTVLAAFAVNGVGIVALMVYLAFCHYFHLTWLLLLLILPLQILFTWGMASLLSAGCVFIRDVRELLGLLLMVWFFATPIIYPISMVPESLKFIIELNPMATFVALYRGALLMHQIDPGLVGRAVILSVGSYVLGAWFFMRAKPAFGDVL